MKKISMIYIVLLFVSIGVNGQSDNKKYEVFLGYSFENARFDEYKKDSGLKSVQSKLADKNKFNKSELFKRGFEASGVYNFSRYVGGKATFSLHTNKRSGKINKKDFVVKERLINYLGGVQIKDNSKDAAAVRPFAHALIGVANTKSSLKNCTEFETKKKCPASLNKSTYGFTSKFGGGLDVKIDDNITFRAIQLDYQKGKISQGFGFSTGIVF